MSRLSVRILLALGAIGLLPFLFACAQNVTPAPPTAGQGPGVNAERTPPPIESYGYLLSFSRGSRPIQFVLTPLGTANNKTISLASSTSPVLEDASVTPNGDIVFVGSYSRSDSGLHSNFLAEINPTTTAVVFTKDLGSFSAERSCATADGQLWVLGQDFSYEISGSGSPYDMIRSYTASGEFTRSYVNRQLLPSDTILDFHSDSNKNAFLTCGTSSVGFYVVVQGAGYWNEVDVTTGALTNAQTNVPPARRITGLTLLGPHNVYASIVGNDSQRHVYHLTSAPNTETQSWRIIKTGFETPGGALRVLGSNNGALVYLVPSGPGQNAMSIASPTPAN
jgi:hypothetical protein